MRVICPFTEVTPGTDQCLARLAPQAERVYVGDDVLGYWRMLCAAWRDAEDFILWEHDLECEADAIEILQSCPQPACPVAGYFRLTRFRAEMMRAIPDVFETLPVS